MRYLLDTDICAYYINGREPQVRQRVQSISDSDIAISAITKGEMYAGAVNSQTPRRSRVRQDLFFSRFVSLPFDDAAADSYGHIRARLKRSGMLIGRHDMQIAAIAIVHGLTVATHNTKHFSRIPELNIEDWVES